MDVLRSERNFVSVALLSHDSNAAQFSCSNLPTSNWPTKNHNHKI